MKETCITPKMLRENGFEEKLLMGKIFYVKGIVGVNYDGFWIPYNMETGLPITPIPIRIVTTIEELELLAKEAGIKV
jgi:hypothetical protein